MFVLCSHYRNNLNILPLALSFFLVVFGSWIIFLIFPFFLCLASSFMLTFCFFSLVPSIDIHGYFKIRVQWSIIFVWGIVFVSQFRIDLIRARTRADLMATRRVDPMYNPHGEAYTPTADERLTLVLVATTCFTKPPLQSNYPNIPSLLVLTNSTISLDRVLVLLTDRE